MTRKSLLFTLLMALLAPLALQAQGLVKATNPVLQTAPIQELAVQKMQPTRAAGWLQYDNGTLATNLGSSTAYYWTYGPMYPASMLGNNNTLSRVSFYENTYMITDVTINIYSGGDEEPETLLYTEDVPRNGSNGFHEVELAEMVTIDPTQNLWIILTVGGTYVMPLCQSNEVNNDWWNNGGWGHMSNAWQSGYGWMIRGYVEYIEPSSCPRPTALSASNVTPYAATLSWSSSDEVNAWQVVYSIREGFDPDSATPIDVDENPYTLTNLSDATTYYAYVRAVCDAHSYSAWSSMVSFTTPSACTPPFNLDVTDIAHNAASINWEGYQDTYTLRYKTAVFYDGFENGLDLWTIYTEGEAPQENGWYTMDPTSLVGGAHGGDYAVSSWSWSSNAYDADNWLITPQLSIQGTLSFWVYTNPGYPDHYEVLFATEGNAIDDFTVTLQEMATAPATGAWEQVIIDLSAYAGQQGYIAIHHADYDANYLLIDDFLIESSDAWTTVNNATSPYDLEGLTPETSYSVQIQGTCPSGQTDWSSIAFTTLSACSSPIDLEASDITANSADLSWVGYQDSYNVQYRTAGYTPVYFEDDFDETHGASWTRIDGYTNYHWSGSSDYFILFGQNGSGDTQYAISPELGGEFEEGSYLYFAYRHIPQVSADSAMILKVGYSTTTADLEAFTWGEEMTSAYNWTEFEEEIPAGTKYFAIQTTDAFEGVGLVVDYVGVYAPAVEAGEWVLVENVTAPYELGYLDPGTWYEWQVQGINASCEGGLTEWSESGYFLTEEQTTVTQTVALASGTNWFSTYVEITLADLQNALVAALPGTTITIKSQNDGSTTYNGSRWRGQLNSFDVTKMYKIEVTADSEIVLEGMPLDPAEHPVTIVNGANWIGFPFSTGMTVSDAFAGFAVNGDQVSSQGNGSTTYNGSRWRGQLTNLVPGQGYNYKSAATETRTFTFPAGTK